MNSTWSMPTNCCRSTSTRRSPPICATANRYEGILLSFDAQRLVLAGDKDKGPIFVVERGDNIKRIQFSKLPEGLLTRPTLVWEVEAANPGKHLVEVSYIAKQIRWRADYNLVVSADDKTINLSRLGHRRKQYAASASPTPRSSCWPATPRPISRGCRGRSGPSYYKTVATLPPTDKIGNDPSQMIGDYRIYSLPEATTVANNQIKQVELIRANKVPSDSDLSL